MFLSLLTKFVDEFVDKFVYKFVYIDYMDMELAQKKGKWNGRGAGRLGHSIADPECP